MSFSLKQKIYFAKRDGKKEVVLTMEEAELVLQAMGALDRRIARAMELMSPDALDEFSNEIVEDIEQT
jgi:hypothetical protein